MKYRGKNYIIGLAENMVTKFTVKVVIFSVINGKLSVFLEGHYLPQGGLMSAKSLQEVANEIIKSSLGKLNRNNFVEQLYTFSHPEAGGTEVDVVYYLLMPENDIENIKVGQWIHCDRLDKSLREYSVISYAVQRLAWKMEYTNVVYSLLPRDFTLSELQTVYEAIIGKKLDKRNFRKKILSLKLLRKLGKKRHGLHARPAEMYRFRKRTPEIVKVFS